MFNKVFIIGNLTKDPEIKLTNGGKKIANFSIAVNNKENADFFNCVAWEKLADILGEYTHKGSKIAIYGRLQNRSWDKPDGTKGYATDIIVNEVNLLDSKEKIEQPF